MSDVFTIKQNDTAPSITATLYDADGVVVDLTGASVTFHMRHKDGTVKVDAAAVVANNSGIVRYDWIAADTDTVGRYNAEFEVTYGDASIETFPNGRYLRINIKDDIA